MTANFTGSLRLLVGLGWPMIYTTAAIFNRINNNGKLRHIKLDDEHSIEVTGLILPILYFIIIVAKGTLSIYDSIILISIYITYIFILNKMPSKEEEELNDFPIIPRKILNCKPYLRNIWIFILFFSGGLILYFVVEPFLHSMLALALIFGVSDFVFVQWVSPFLSEFPEKLTAFNWAKRVKHAPIALMNMVSSNINQWTVLAAMIPIVYNISLGSVTPIIFDHHQKIEILLTIAQALLAFIFLANMNFSLYEAVGLFILWLMQFLMPSTREEMIFVYIFWAIIEVIRILLKKRALTSFYIFRTLIKEYF
jgi:cation:H+ antiporter